MADPKQFFELLHTHSVEYVVIDKIAAALHGVPVLAESIAIFPQCERPNNERLADALTQANGQLELVHGTSETAITAELLETGWRQLPMGQGHRFSTSMGIVDIVYLPDGLEQE